MGKGYLFGYASRALAAPSDRRPYATLIIDTPGDPNPASEGESPFPLDLYLSWMTPFLPSPLSPLRCRTSRQIKRCYRWFSAKLSNCEQTRRHGGCYRAREWANYGNSKCTVSHIREPPHRAKSDLLRHLIQVDMERMIAAKSYAISGRCCQL